MLLAECLYYFFYLESCEMQTLITDIFYADNYNIVSLHKLMANYLYFKVDKIIYNLIIPWRK